MGHAASIIEGIFVSVLGGALIVNTILAGATFFGWVPPRDLSAVSRIEGPSPWRNVYTPPAIRAENPMPGNSAPRDLFTPPHEILRNRAWRTCTDADGNERNVSPRLDDQLAPYIVVDFAQHDDDDEADSSDSGLMATYNLHVAEAAADALDSQERGEKLSKREEDDAEDLQTGLEGDVAAVHDRLTQDMQGQLVSQEGNITETTAQGGMKDVVGIWRDVLEPQDGVFGVIRNEKGLIMGLSCPVEDS